MVTYNGSLLKEGRDYTIQITSTDSGESSAGINAGTVTLIINGIGNYTGTKTVSFSIQPKELPSEKPDYSCWRAIYQ